jgi:hypothetical protein
VAQASEHLSTKSEILSSKPQCLQKEKKELKKIKKLVTEYLTVEYDNMTYFLFRWGQCVE